MVRQSDAHNNTCTTPPSSERRTSCAYASASADYAVKKTFAILGVNIDEPREVQDFQESLRFGDKLRKAADKGTMVFILAVAGAMATALWVGLIEKIRSAAPWP